MFDKKILIGIGAIVIIGLIAAVASHIELGDNKNLYNSSKLVSFSPNANCSYADLRYELVLNKEPIDQDNIHKRIEFILDDQTVAEKNDNMYNSLKKGNNQLYNILSADLFKKDITFNKIKITYYDEVNNDNLFAVLLTVDKTTLKYYEYKPTSSSSSSNSNVSVSSTTSNSDVQLTTKINSDGSVTYNGHGTVGGVTATYNDYTIYKDGHTTGSCTIDY